MTARPHSRHLEELLPAFALGALDGDELRELAEHLTPEQGTPAAHAAQPAEAPPEVACRICAAELRRLADDLEVMAMLEEPEEAAAVGEAETWSAAAGGPMEAPIPSADLRRQLLAQVAAEPRPSPAGAELAGRRRSPAAVIRGQWPRLAAAALLLVAVWGVTRQAGLASEIQRLRGERDRLAERAGALERQVQEAQAQSERLQLTLSILAAPSVESVRLAAMGSSHAAGRTYVDAADRKAVFYASGLPALAPDKTYQLWYIDDEDRKTSAGVFDPDPQGKAALMVDQRLPVERIQSWAVTVEPRGGRPQPTGPIALAG